LPGRSPAPTVCCCSNDRQARRKCGRARGCKQADYCWQLKDPMPRSMRAGRSLRLPAVLPPQRKPSSKPRSRSIRTSSSPVRARPFRARGLCRSRLFAAAAGPHRLGLSETILVFAQHRTFTIAIARQMFQEILRLIAELRSQPPPALARDVRCHAFKSNRQKECVQMPGEMARPDPRPSARVTRGAGSSQHLGSVLREGRETRTLMPVWDSSGESRSK
jgi:hypothetical protein